LGERSFLTREEEKIISCAIRKGTKGDWQLEGLIYLLFFRGGGGEVKASVKKRGGKRGHTTWEGRGEPITRPEKRRRRFQNLIFF